MAASNNRSTIIITSCAWIKFRRSRHKLTDRAPYFVNQEKWSKDTADKKYITMPEMIFSREVSGVFWSVKLTISYTILKK